MALPREQDTYEDYTDQLVYFSARLAANPVTEVLAPKVDAIVDELDAGYEALRAARRAEVRARAKRDHQDGLGDEQLKKVRGRLRVVGNDHFVIGRVFPKGLAHVIAPRGRPQLDRLDALVTAIDDVLASPQLAADADGDELRTILDNGKTTAVDARAALGTRIEEWEATTLAVARARDAFNFHRADGVGRAGAVLGELRSLLGGSVQAAYGYTQSGRSKSGPAELAEPEADAAEAPAAAEG